MRAAGKIEFERVTLRTLVCQIKVKCIPTYRDVTRERAVTVANHATLPRLVSRTGTRVSGTYGNLPCHPGFNFDSQRCDYMLARPSLSRCIAFPTQERGPCRHLLPGTYFAVVNGTTASSELYKETRPTRPRSTKRRLYPIRPLMMLRSGWSPSINLGAFNAEKAAEGLSSKEHRRTTR